MRRLLLPALLLAATLVPAQAQVEAFRFQSDRVQVGKVFHYLKTDFDGTHPEHVSIWVADRDHIESFKFHPGESPAALVTAEMDWSTFSARSLVSWQLYSDAPRKLAAKLDPVDGKRVRVEVPVLGKPAETVEIGFLPWHIYNFDLASLNIALPHLADPQGRFKVGIADPNFADGPTFIYRGEAEVSYLGEETRGGVLCRKYRIDGPGLQNRGGFLWVNQAQGHIEDAEIDLPDNPAWTHFKFRLTGVETMDRQAWERYQKEQIKPR